MKTTATHRSAKYHKEVQREARYNKFKLDTDRAIERNEEKIRELKNDIIDCLNQNFFDMAKSKMAKIDQVRTHISDLCTNLSNYKG